MIAQQRAYFSIQSSRLSPDEINRHVGITPSETEAKESRQARPTGRLVPARHDWVVKSGLPETASLDDQVAAVLSHLDGASGRIGELTATGSEARLIIFRSFEPGPGSTRLGLVLREEAIEFLHEAGAYVWIDEYGFDDEDDEEEFTRSEIADTRSGSGAAGTSMRS